ncbi:MAG: hypothetical protein LBB74_06525 [Chitinispirillales bacterium]|jgi:hypothetical protein|nr:hypothetical protein [Chitinispirillales bacterium]
MADNSTFFAIFDRLIKEIDAAASLKKKYRVLLTDALRKSAVSICDRYTSIRNNVKQSYMKRSDERLDRHKCAAAFIIAFLEKLEIRDVTLSKTLMREHLAIQVGLIVLGIFIGEDKDTALAEFLDDNKGFVLPDIIHVTRQKYLYIWAVELRYQREDRKLSVLPLAHELFYLESYNKLRMENEAVAKTRANAGKTAAFGEITLQRKNARKTLPAKKRARTAHRG